MNTISFPGLGIEPFQVNRVAFTIFGRQVMWYGVLITIGMILAVLCAIRLATKKEGISLDDITDFAFIVILCGVLGARLYYVIFYWNQGNYLVTSGNFFYNLWHTFVNCIAIWEGGLAIYGGVLAGMLTGYLFARKRKIPFLKIFDILVPCVLIGQVIGRWGNFFNVEAYGSETTLPWRMGVDLMTGNAKFVHPTFFYESLWNFILLVVVLTLLYPKKKFDGEIFCSYMIWYGFGRMLIEGLRSDSLMLGSLRVSQGVGFLCFVIGIIVLIALLRKYHASQDEKGGYAPVYAAGEKQGVGSQNKQGVGSQNKQASSSQNKQGDNNPEKQEDASAAKGKDGDPDQPEKAAAHEPEKNG